MHKHGLAVVLYVGNWVSAHFVKYERTMFNPARKHGSLQFLDKGDSAILLKAFRAASRAVALSSFCRSAFRVSLRSLLQSSLGLSYLS